MAIYTIDIFAFFIFSSSPAENITVNPAYMIIITTIIHTNEFIQLIIFTID